MSVRVVAPCRLHFGLFHVPVDGLTHYPDGRPVRKFGGLGLMIDNPCVTVTAHRNHHHHAHGSLEVRTRRYLERLEWLLPTYPEWSMRAEGPPEHTGLGVGTALGMAVTAARDSVAWLRDNSIETAWTFAARVERGLRSGIGVVGFQGGGFLIDDGRGDEQTEPRVIFRFYFPDWWPVLVVRPPVPSAWFGDSERTAFARKRPADSALQISEHLRALAFDTIGPAIEAGDFDTFAHSIHEFNRRAGEPFHDDQGGPYASPEVACMIDELQEMGAVGVGQSSWGPTVFAFAKDADEAEHLATKARDRFSSATEVTVTAANNTGARLEKL